MGYLRVFYGEFFYRDLRGACANQTNRDHERSLLSKVPLDSTHEILA